MANFTTTPERNGAQIALVGSFNPSIFSPDWFKSNNLIPSESFPDDALEIIHPEIAKFHTNEIAIEVRKDKFTATSFSAPLSSVKELVVSLFGSYLPHTPISLVGLNTLVDFKIESIDKFESFGLKLAPREPWGEWGAKLGDDPKNRGGLMAIEMDQRALDDRSQGWIKTRVQGSTLAQYAIHVLVNDHYPLACDGKYTENGSGAAEFIEERWKTSTEDAGKIIDHLMKVAKEG